MVKQVFMVKQVLLHRGMVEVLILKEERRSFPAA